MANAFQVLGNMQRLAAALTEAGRRGGFPPEQAATLLGTAAGLWASRSILETALDHAEATKRRALAIVPPAAEASACAPSAGATAPPARQPVAASRPIGMKGAAVALGCSRAELTVRARASGLAFTAHGQWWIPESDLHKLAPRRRSA